MTAAHPVGVGGGAGGDDAGSHAAPGIAGWLRLAATPTFAAMALLTGPLGGQAMNMLCSPGPGAALSGMAPMYLLMSAFHLPPWFRLAPAVRAWIGRAAACFVRRRVF